MHTPIRFAGVVLGNLAGLYDRYVCHGVVSLCLTLVGSYALLYIADNRPANAQLSGFNRTQRTASAWYVFRGVDSLCISKVIALLGCWYVALGLCVGGAVYDSQYLQ